MSQERMPVVTSALCRAQAAMVSGMAAECRQSVNYNNHLPGIRRLCREAEARYLDEAARFRAMAALLKAEGK